MEADEGRFPKRNKKDKEEDSLYEWLRQCKPGGRNWTQARWEKLNEAFGEGWEKECFPYLETGTWGFQPGVPLLFVWLHVSRQLSPSTINLLHLGRRWLLFFLPLGLRLRRELWI